MKIFLPLFFLFFSETSFAQFNTIKQGTNNYKVKVLEIEKDGKTIDARAIDFLKNEPEKSDSLKVDSLTEKYAHLSIEELRFFIKELEAALEKQNKHKKTLPKQIHKLYEGKNHHLNIQNLLQVMTEVGLSNKLFVMAQGCIGNRKF